MARIPQIMRPEDHPDPDVDQEALERAFERYGEYHANTTRTLGTDPYAKMNEDAGTAAPMSPSWALTLHDPEFGWRLIHLSDYILCDLEWGKRHDLRELMIFVIAKHMKSEFAFRVHYPTGLAVGLSAEQIASLDYWRESDLYNEEEKFVIEFVEAALTTGVSDELFERGRAFYGDKGMMEMTFSLSYWTFWSLNLNILKPSVPTESLQAAAVAVGAGSQG